jgi:hypothetical protein
MKSNQALRGLLARAPLASAVAVALLTAPAAHAFEFGKGDWTGSLDTTISYGYSWRVQDIDSGLIAKAHYDPLICAHAALFPSCAGGFPGSAYQIAAPGRFSANRDDGDLKYGKGDAVSSAFKITSEFNLKYGQNTGFFARASYFYDFENANRDDLTQIAKEKVGEDLRLLDLFVYHDFNLGDHKLSVRFGRQVESWGESTFIQNGINVINPVDVSKLRVAGAELKEAFLPVSMITGSFNVTDNLSVEALYLLQWHETEIDPSGTYFSSNDFASPGATYVMLGFGTQAQPVANPELFASTCGPGGSALNSDLLATYTAQLGSAALAQQAITFGCGNAVPRSPDHNPRGNGQYGLKIDWLAENWGNTEFGFYFLNYHSRLPLLSGTAVTGSSATTGRYFVEYPEDIQLYGMSWNTTIPGGIAWQGELSYRPNMPLQMDDVELLFAALSPLNSFIGLPAAKICSQLYPDCGHANFGQYIRGWSRNRVSQLQMTFTKAFAQVLGAEQVALVGEVGATEVWDLPDQSVLRYEGEGTDSGGGLDVGTVFAGAPGSFQTDFGGLRNPLTLTRGFPTQFSWGYRLAARADYNSAFGTSFNVSPRIAFNHDVNGITPGPGGNFLEGRKSLTLGVQADYLSKLVFDLSYTAFAGGGRGSDTTVTVPAGGTCNGGAVLTTATSCTVPGTPFNQIKDRDFASFTVKYSF